MMRLSKFLISLSLILPLISLVGCSANPVVIKTEKVETTYIKQPAPKGVVLRDVHFFVVNDQNLQGFREKVRNDSDAMVFIAITVDDYENLSVNLAELKRYVDQQKVLIQYYEDLLVKKDINSSKPQ